MGIGIFCLIIILMFLISGDPGPAYHPNDGGTTTPTEGGLANTTMLIGLKMALIWWNIL